jgi:hypothetical protein
MRVNIVWPTPEGDRILDRLARTLGEQTGWSISPRPAEGVDLNYDMCYIDLAQRFTDWRKTPWAAYFSHFEGETPYKKFWWETAAPLCKLQTVTAAQYGGMLRNPVRIIPPVDPVFQIMERKVNIIPVIGVSGFVDRKSGRKGVGLAARLAGDLEGEAEMAASGDGWPLRHVNRSWEGMVDFYNSLDLFICTSLVEGIPMPPLEALACGIPVVIPRGVGMLDELTLTLKGEGEGKGIWRYEAGNYEELKKAVMGALEVIASQRAAQESPTLAMTRMREELRGCVAGYTPEAYARSHVEGFERFGGGPSTGGRATVDDGRATMDDGSSTMDDGRATVDDGWDEEEEDGGGMPTGGRAGKARSGRKLAGRMGAGRTGMSGRPGMAGGEEMAGERAAARGNGAAVANGDEYKLTHDRHGQRGVYYVAYGEPALRCAEGAIGSFKQFFPEIPVAVVSETPNRDLQHYRELKEADFKRLAELFGRVVELADVFIEHEDEDIGGRAAKVMIDKLAPKEWTYISYLDVDTEVIAAETFLWNVVEDGWDMAICKNPSRFHVISQMKRSDNGDECDYTFRLLGTDQLIQLNGGVFCYQRNPRTRAFFQRWEAEWRRYGKRDQAALLRALFANPIKLYVLGNEWNTITRYDGSETAAWLLHYPMTARRWRGMVHYRLDDPQAWKAVREFEKTLEGKG